MAIGSISTNPMSTGAAGTRLAGSTAGPAAGPAAGSAAPGTQVAEEKPTIADHVAAADEQEPIRSASSTQGTLVDTYL